MQTQSEMERAVRQLLDQCQIFLGYDLAQEGLERFPNSRALKQAAALALLETGALAEAQAVLAALSADPEADHEAETLGLLACAAKEEWRRSGSPADAVAARDAYLRGDEALPSLWMRINAATLSWIVGDPALASRLARRCLEETQEQPENTEANGYWLPATAGEALLLLDRADEAVHCYKTAAALAGRHYAAVASSRRQIDLLATHGFPVPAPIFDLLKPPSVVVFTGHMLDSPSRPHPRFPASQEAAVRAQIVRHLDHLDARIGCCSVACGSDLLFIEAMHERGAEVHLLLPYAREDFLMSSVAFAGEAWVKRFDAALAYADSVRYVTEESMLGDESVFTVMGPMLRGYAALTAQPLGAVPALLAVWDGQVNALPGGTSDMVTGWPDRANCHVIPLENRALDAGPPLKVERPPAQRDSPRPGAATREIKTLLFADVVGYSKIQEDRVPAFMFQFLQRIAGHLAPKPRFVNTWGDAIFALMDTATDLAAYALSLQEIVCDTDWTEFGLPTHMSVRVGLHAGPVFAAVDPITGTLNYYGSHVNRAARLEAVTIPGQVYASEPFAALLTAEQQMPGAAKRYACDYIGTLTLHNKFGTQPTYHLRRV